MLETQNLSAAESRFRLSRSASVLTILRDGGWQVPAAAVFVCSMLVTLIFWQVIPQQFHVDQGSDYSFSYKPLAENILAGRGYVRSSEQALASENTPGYPLILAGAFKLAQWTNVRESAIVAALSVVGMALFSVFVFLLARMLWGTLPAVLAAFLSMTYPFALWLTKQPNSEIPFMVFLYAGLCLFWYGLSKRPRANIFFCCGLLFGAAMLVRPIAIGIAFVMSFAAWFMLREVSRKRRLLLITMLLLGSFVAVLPWEAFLYRKTGSVVMLSTTGVKAMLDGLTFGADSKGYRENNMPADVQQVMENVRARLGELRTPADVASILYLEFQSRPVAVTKLLLLKIARSWYGTDTGRRELPILLIQLVYLVAASLGAWRIWKLGGRNRDFVMCGLLVVFYFWGMTFLALSILRYMVPVIGLLAILIGGFWAMRNRPMPNQNSDAMLG